MWRAWHQHDFGRLVGNLEVKYSTGFECRRPGPDGLIESNPKLQKALVQNELGVQKKFESRLPGPTIQFFHTLSHCKRWFKNLLTFGMNPWRRTKGSESGFLSATFLRTQQV
jgi:hypothetical protein